MKNEKEQLKNPIEYDEAPEPLFKTDSADIEEPVDQQESFAAPDVPEDEEDIEQGIQIVLTIGTGTINTANRTISWPVTLNYPAGQLVPASLTDLSPSNACTTVTGSGLSYTVTLSGFNAGTSGNASFAIRRNIFTQGLFLNSYTASSRVAYSFAAPVSVSIGSGTVNEANRTISWPVTLGSSGLTGFDVSDIISRCPSGATVAVSGSGTSRTVTFSGFNVGDNDTASFSIRANAFTASSLPSTNVNNVQVNATGAAYDFRSRVTATVGSGTVNTANRTISWPMTLSSSGLSGFNASDIINRSPSGATVAVSGSGTAYTVTFSGFNVGDSGSADFSIRADAFTGSSLPSNRRNNVQSEATAVAYDFRSRVTATVGTGSVNTANRTVSWPVTLSSSGLSGFNASDIINRSPSGATVGVSGSGTSYTVIFSGFNVGSSGSADFSIRANAFTTASLPSNRRNNVQAEATAVAYDFRDRVSITIGTGTVNTGNRTVSWNLTFSDSGLSGFSSSDIINRSPSSASVSVTGSGTTRTVTFGPFNIGDSGSADFSIQANAFTSSSLPSNHRNNVQVNATAASYDFRGRASVTISAATVNTTNRTITWPITLSSSSLMGLTDADIINRSPSNAQVAVSVSAGSGTITFSGLTANTSGNASFSIRANAFTSQSLPSNTRNNIQINATAVAYNFQNRVTATVGTGTVNTANRTISWPVTLSHSGLTGFDASDIINRRPSAATVAVSGSGTNRTVTFSGFVLGNTGSADFAIRANAFTSLPSNTRNNVQAEATAVAYDFRPRVTVSIGIGTVNTGNRTISWPIALSSSRVTGFNNSDIINRSPSGATVTLTGSGSAYTVTFGPFNAGDSGSADFSIIANAFTASSLPANTRNNLQADATAVAYNFQSRVTATIGTGTVNTTNRTISWPVTLNSAGLSGFNASDIINRSPSGATVAVSGSGTAYTVTFGPFNVGDSGSADFSIRANAFTASSLPSNRRNNVQSEATAVSYNFSSYSATWSPLSVGQNRSISGTITLSENPGSAFSVTEDFIVQIRSGTGTTQDPFTWTTATGWTLTST